MPFSTAHSWLHNNYFVAEESADDARRPTVYLDTSIPSYLTAWQSRDFLIAHRQRITHIWWHRHRHRYTLRVSERVHVEAAAGDIDAAAARRNALSGIDSLDFDSDAKCLSEKLIGSSMLPPRALADAEHIAIAARNSIQFLLTWNCTHLANRVIHRAIVRTCEVHGFRCPEVCTPEQLMRIYTHERPTS